MHKTKKVLGLMSGTSLDGLDICFIEFTYSENEYTYKIIHAETIAYMNEWLNRLKSSYSAEDEFLQNLDKEYGKYLADCVNDFCRKFQIKPELISSHGHTVYHQPAKGITLQIGDGKEIYKHTLIPVAYNFRQQDVALGGQGAPLVPIGDRLLFSNFDMCLNLGGFSNISWEENGLRLACDIGPCNILLNRICAKIALQYDKDGMIASKGKIVPKLIDKWNALAFFSLAHPKSLGREWFEENYEQDICLEEITVEDLLASAVEHISYQIHSFVRSIPKRYSNVRILCTGGGVKNKFLISRLQEKKEIAWIIPDLYTIDFKEALIFGLLGLLRSENKINVLASVTGASQDHCSGDFIEKSNSKTLLMN